MRATKLSGEPIPLGDGVDPPAGKINPDYVQQPGNSRRCVQCNKWHDTIVENTMTGERLKEIDKCIDCLMSGCFCAYNSDQRFTW